MPTKTLKLLIMNNLRTVTNNLESANQVNTNQETATLKSLRADVQQVIKDYDMENLFFNVQKIESTDILPSFNAISEYRNFVIGNIDNKPTILNCCSDRYKLIKNSEIFPIIIEMFSDLFFGIFGIENCRYR